jgi:predicted nuclease with TOPRIM domain
MTTKDRQSENEYITKAYLGQELGTLKTEIRDMFDELGIVLKKSFEGTYVRLDRAEESITELKVTVSIMAYNIDKLTDKVVDLSVNLDEVKDRVTVIENTMLTMVTNSFVLYEEFEELSFRVTAIQEKV